tara:strand:- start:912 stop:1109 length:198 start_codon:yes stop_codon:yes gene_type:complete
MFDYIAYIEENDTEYQEKYNSDIMSLKSRNQILQDSLANNYQNYTIFATTSVIITIIGLSMMSSK